MRKDELLNALIAVKPGVAKREITESMTYFFFTGEHVVTYNDIISIQYPLKTEFTTFVKAQQFFDVVSKVKTDTIQFDLTDGKLNMKAGKIRSSFATIEDAEFISTMDSVIKSTEGLKFKKIKEDFIDAIRMCSFVASSNESDRTITSVHVENKIVSATDNARIALSTISTKMERMLIKASEIKSIVDISPVSYAISKSWIHFKGESDCLFSIRSIKGTFPEVAPFFKFEGTKIELPSAILDGLDLASIFMDNESPSVSIALRKGACRIYKEGEGGVLDYREKVDYDGDNIKFGINPAFLKEMLSHSTEIIVSQKEDQNSGEVVTDKVKLTSGNFTMVTAVYPS